MPEIAAHIKEKAWENIYTFSGGNREMWEGYRLQNASSSGTFPTVFYLNEQGNISHHSSGFQNSTQIKDNVIKAFGDTKTDIMQDTNLEFNVQNIDTTQITKQGLPLTTADGATIYIPTSLFEGQKTIKVHWSSNVQKTHTLKIYIDGMFIDYTIDPITIVLPGDYGNILLNNGNLLPVQQFVEADKRTLKLQNLRGSLSRTDATITFFDIANVGDKQYIEEIAKRSLIKGENGKFSPTKNLTRKQVSSMLSRSLIGTGTNTIHFTDLRGNEALNEINGLYEKGIWKASDFNDSEFEPSKNVTRQEAIVLVYRTLQAYGVTLTKAQPTFIDSNQLTTTEAKQAAGALQKAGIFVGNDGKLKPQNNLTRAQFAKVLYLTIQMLEQ